MQKSFGVFKQFAVESSNFVFNGRFLVAYISRIPLESTTLKIVDWASGDLVASVSSQGFALGCVYVEQHASGDTLHYIGTANVGAPGNS